MINILVDLHQAFYCDVIKYIVNVILVANSNLQLCKSAGSYIDNDGSEQLANLKCE